MKNKSSIIFLIIILSICVVALLGVMLYFIFHQDINGFDFLGKREVLYKEVYDVEALDEITFDLASTDVTIKESTKNQIELEIQGRKKEEFEVGYNERKLHVESESTFCFGFCMIDTKVTISIPQNYKEKISIHTKSGDVKLYGTLESQLDIKTASGDVEIDHLKNNIIVQTKSGDIEIISVKNGILNTSSGDIDVREIDNVEIKTHSGDVDLKTVHMTNNGKIKTMSGDVEISNIANVYIKTDTSSGDARISNNDRLSKIILSISTMSGDIEVN